MSQPFSRACYTSGSQLCALSVVMSLSVLTAALSRMEGGILDWWQRSPPGPVDVRARPREEGTLEPNLAGVGVGGDEVETGHVGGDTESVAVLGHHFSER